MLNVTCAIILKGDKILITQRSEVMKLPLKWEFPGGKLEDGEIDEECIIREIREELNIEIKILSRLSNSIFDYGEFVVNLIPFVTEYVKGNLILAEHSDFRWLTKETIGQFDFAEADIPILNEFLSISK